MAIHLNKRETYAVALALVVVGFWCLYQFVLLPFTEEKALLQRQIIAKQGALSEMVRLREEYEKLVQDQAARKKRYALREESFTLFSSLEKLAVKAGVSPNIEYMKPSTAKDKISSTTISLVEMKLKEINTQQLMSFLYHVETSDNVVYVERLSVTRQGKKKNVIDAVMKVAAISG